MKKLLSTALITLTVISFSFAQQTVANDFYLMKNTSDAEYVLKAINMELKLSEADFAKVKDLLFASAKSQGEQLKSTPAPDAERINVMKTRQTVHIENSLKAILGVAGYNLYLNNKATIEANLKTIKKS
jgi:hypothetical protein